MGCSDYFFHNPYISNSKSKLIEPDQPNTDKNYLDDEVKLINSIDLAKLNSVARKSLPWVVAIMTITVLGAYLFIRWSIPIYESSSELKLDTKSEASVLTMNNFSQPPNYANISGEIEILKSRLFFSKVIEAADIDVSYFAVGNVRTDERYIHSPIVVNDYDILDSRMYDKKFYVEILSEDKYKLTYDYGGRETSKILNFTDTLRNEYFNISVDLRHGYHEEYEGTRHYFVVNSYKSLINYLKSNMKVEAQVLEANTIKVSFTAFNQFKARDLVNAIDTLYLKYTESEKLRANQQKINFLDEQLAQTEIRLEEFENYFENFTVSNQTVDLDNELKETIIVINKLDSQQFYLRNRIGMLKELETDFADDHLFLVTPSQREQLPQTLAEELNTLIELKSEKDMLLTSQNENTYAVRRKVKQIETLQDKLLSQLSDLIVTLERNLVDIAARKQRLESEFALLPSKNTDFTKSKRYYQLYEEFYLSLMQNKAEFQIAQAGVTTDFKILSPANLPDSPIHPNKPYVLAIGTIAGLIISFIFISIRYITHNKVNTVEEIESAAEAAFLGTVPYVKSSSVASLIINSSSRSAVSEALRSIRTNLSFMSLGKELKVLSVSSTISGEGKTFVSVNLGAVIALSGKKVVVVDLDMRKPKVHLAFAEQPSAVGMSTLLSSQSKLKDCIRKSPIPGLEYVEAGPTPPNPSELLLNGSFEEILSALRKDYDMIILDTPPTGLVTDGIIAMKHADVPIYVMRSDYSKKGFIQNINRLMKMNRFDNLAVVLNSVRGRKGHGYGYGYGYGYYAEDKSKSSFLKVWRRASV